MIAHVERHGWNRDAEAAHTRTSFLVIRKSAGTNVGGSLICQELPETTTSIISRKSERLDEEIRISDFFLVFVLKTVNSA